MQKNSPDRYRQDLLELFSAGLHVVGGRQCVKKYFTHHPLAEEDVALVAIGKAASSMTLGAVEYLGDRLHSGLVITRYGHLSARLSRFNNLQCLESGHPVPDPNSLAAGQALLEYLQHLPDDIPLIFLLSGGASALVEVLPPGSDLERLQAVNDYLLSSGLAIDEMNRIRTLISRIKGGRLAAYTGQRRVINLLLSDVPENDPAVIGSGLLVPASNRGVLPSLLPDWIKSLVNANPIQPGPDDPGFQQIETIIIGDNRQACTAILRQAESMGYHTSSQPGRLTGDAVAMAGQIVQTLKNAGPGLLVWGGETTVTLPERPGRGGRNQHLALALALKIQGDNRFYILAAGTDGSDGATGDAGALVDGQTVLRGELEGLSAADCLKQADAGRFLAASGDLINTGPTDTNVMDMVISIKV